jgi:hypothetical protein
LETPHGRADQESQGLYSNRKRCLCYGRRNLQEEPTSYNIASTPRQRQTNPTATEKTTSRKTPRSDPDGFVTRGSFGWSKTTPARSFATFGPNFLKIVDAGRKRHGTSLPALRREGCFFSVLLSFCTKDLAVRVNRLDCETAIFFDGVHLLPRR